MQSQKGEKSAHCGKKFCEVLTLKQKNTVMLNTIESDHTYMRICLLELNTHYITVPFYTN
jgi:hypothetical protein